MTDLQPVRCFLAFWPRPEVRQTLYGWSQKVHTRTGGRRVKCENLHLTVAFLGALDPDQLEAVRGCCAASRCPATTLMLDRLGFWRRPGIVWAGAVGADPSLVDAIADLHADIRAGGVVIDARAFVPHVTLIRKATNTPTWSPPLIRWSITELCLVASQLSPAGSSYRVLDRWSL